MNSHTRQLQRVENTSSALLAIMPIPNEYQKSDTMRLQYPVHVNTKVINVRAIHHYIENDNRKPLSTVEMELQLDGGQTKYTTMRHSEIKEIERGKAELANFGSPIQDPVFDSHYIKLQC